MAAYFSVRKKKDGSAVVESSNANAKQVFFGWGSDQDAIDGSFYGNQVGSWRGDNTRWKWTLTSSGVSRMRGNLARHINDPSYYPDGPEKRAAQELLRKL